MKTVHFDVDAELDKYLEGEKYPYSLTNVKDKNKFADTEVISIKSVSEVNESSLSGFPKLKLLITRTVGTDHIDLDYCKQKGIVVRNIPDYGAFNIAEHAFALVLSGTRNIVASQKKINQGVFSYQGLLSYSLKGKTLGVVGTGKIGLEVIKLATAFGMKIIAYDIVLNEKAAKEFGFPYISLEELAETSDIITLHTPYLPGTHHIINSKIINLMKDGAILINTARGELIDTQALIANIKKFRFVGLDVLEEEKNFTKDHPLLKFDNVIVTPHIAFYSDESIKRIAEETMKMVEEIRI